LSLFVGKSLLGCLPVVLAVAMGLELSRGDIKKMMDKIKTPHFKNAGSEIYTM